MRRRDGILRNDDAAAVFKWVFPSGATVNRTVIVDLVKAATATMKEGKHKFAITELLSSPFRSLRLSRRDEENILEKIYR